MTEGAPKESRFKKVSRTVKERAFGVVALPVKVAVSLLWPKGKVINLEDARFK